MKHISFISSIIFLLLFSYSVNGQIIDTTKHSLVKAQTNTTVESSNVSPVDDDFSPGLAFFALVGLFLILADIGAGVIFAIVGLLIIFGLVSFGIISASLIIGLNKNSFTKGFKTFLILTCSIGGLGIGAIGSFIANKVLHWCTSKIAIIAGMTCGLVVGVSVGLISCYIFQKLTTYFKGKLNI